MKTKVSPSGESSSDYCVGQVSGSLTQSSGAASASLSALFAGAGAAPAAGVLFKPAPLVVQFVEGSDAAKVEDTKSKKKPKVKTEAELKLESREASLRNADEAERAPVRRKRAAQEVETEAEHWALKRQRQREDKKKEREKDGRTAFVGNLPGDCTKKTLLKLFRADGAVESVRFRSMVREDPGVPRRVAAIKRQAHPSAGRVNAYVVFKEPEGVTKALRRNGVEIQKDFFIRVDRVSSKAEQNHDHKRSIFVGNLSFELQELPLRRHFEECGAVEAVRLVRDNNTGLGKGFGYILFKSPDSVQLALKLDGSKLEGRAIRVKRSTKIERRAAPAVKKGPKVKGRGRDSFKGVMADPRKKNKKKTGKKKLKKGRKSLSQ
ncbi:RNA-binding protein 34 [Corythoichthys intestinalis]|uniref:RNA-binding protein 34 n=1 Tax=Corythoichthys intestinalis TaxID=161448 RepID=UPI0025A591FA|nr:RNA-binding protein 34 [Corythoichthys intestinalis]